MNGSEKAFIQQTNETMSILQALCEFVDNPLDLEALNIKIDFDKKHDRIIFWNDGLPFTKLPEYLNEFTTHFTIGDGKISYTGKGSKQATMRLVDPYIGKLKIYTFIPEKDYALYGELSINVTNDIAITGDSSIKLSEEALKEGIRSKGTSFILEHPKNEVFDFINRFKEECSILYGRKHRKTDCNIVIDNETIKFKDPLLLDILGEDINKDGVYDKDGIFFFVKTYMCQNKEDKTDIRKFKAVFTYISRDRYYDIKETPDFVKMLRHVGVYTYLGDRLMDYGGNINQMFSGISSFLANAGGVDRVRFGFFCDGNADIFEITSNKGNGITNLCDNVYLTNRYLTMEALPLKKEIGKTANGKKRTKVIIDKWPIFDIIFQDASWFASINRYETNAENSEGLCRDDVVKAMKGIKLKVKSTPSTVSEDIIIKNSKDIDNIITSYLNRLTTSEGKTLFKSFYIHSLSRDIKISKNKVHQLMKTVFTDIQKVETKTA